MTGRLAGKIALITGVGGGIGATAAAMFAAEGARVVGCDLDGDAAARTQAARPRRAARSPWSAASTWATPEQAREWVDEAVATYDGIDVLYNNASTQRFGALDELSVADWDFTMRNELDLVYYTVRAAWPHLKAPRWRLDHQRRLDRRAARGRVHAAERAQRGEGRRPRADAAAGRGGRAVRHPGQRHQPRH